MLEVFPLLLTGIARRRRMITRARRLSTDPLAEVAWPPAQRPRCFACGPTGFVETVASGLVELGHAPEDVLTERFGPTGG